VRRAYPRGGGGVSRCPKGAAPIPMYSACGDRKAPRGSPCSARFVRNGEGAVDTNVLIHYLRGIQATRDELDRYPAKALSLITWRRSWSAQAPPRSPARGTSCAVSPWYPSTTRSYGHPRRRARCCWWPAMPGDFPPANQGCVSRTRS